MFQHQRFLLSGIGRHRSLCPYHSMRYLVRLHRNSLPVSFQVLAMVFHRMELRPLYGQWYFNNITVYPICIIDPRWCYDPYSVSVSASR
jgi:hypothetical protein